MLNPLATQHRKLITQAKRIVIKAGTHVLTDPTGKLNTSRVNNLIRDIAALHLTGLEVILVTSGAVGVGMQALGIKQRPTLIADLQTAAAVGQSRLIEYYNKRFCKKNCLVSQVLLTHDDLRHRKRHLNARNTMLNLLQHRVIPIVNENDAIAADELKIGDNDIISALVAALINADLLILLTTPDGLRKPVAENKTERVPYLETVTEATLQLAVGKTNALSTGGMTTKLKAAQMANKVGTSVVIASGFQKDTIQRILKGEDTGTLIGNKEQNRQPLDSRKRWIAFFHRPEGCLIIDAGAQEALQNKGKSLLPIGIKQVEGSFAAGALVDIVSHSGQKIGHGLVDYSSDEIKKIQGHHGDEINNILGTIVDEEIIHRDNMVLLDEITA